MRRNHKPWIKTWKMNPLKKRHYWTHQQTYQKCCINSLVSLAIRGKFSLIKHANHCCSPGLLQTLVLGFYWFCWPVLLILNLLYCDFSLCDLWQFWYLVIWWSLNDLSIRLQKLKKIHEKFLGSCASS
jgi:hypothetical protein